MDWRKRGGRFSLSPRERAGVRGKSRATPVDQIHVQRLDSSLAFFPQGRGNQPHASFSSRASLPLPPCAPRFKVGHPHDPARSIRHEAAGDSPSPRGEGRGEGERSANSGVWCKSGVDCCPPILSEGKGSATVSVASVGVSPTETGCRMAHPWLSLFRTTLEFCAVGEV